MNDLINYIASLDPSFPASVKGATPQEIDRFEQVVGHPIPQVHRQFFREIGHGLGTFKPFSAKRDFSITTLTEWYSNRKRKPPEAFTMLAQDFSEIGYDLFLEDVPGQKPQVVQFAGYMKFNPDKNGYTIQYESLDQMLYGLAFYEYRIERQKHRVTLQLQGEVDQSEEERRLRMQEFRDLARQLKLTAVPHAEGWLSCFENAKVGVACYQPPLYAPFFRLGAPTEREAFHLAEVLVDNLDLMITDH
jgi:hypothetical protein